MYSLAAPPRWSFPMYLLHDPEMVGTMRGIIDARIPDDIQTGTIISEPTKTPHALLAEITNWAKQTQHEDKVATTIETNKLLSAISKCERFLGTGPHHAHHAAQLPPGPDTDKKKSDTQVQYAHLLRKLTFLYNRLQLTFYLNAGVKEDALGESCWKGFFDHTRNPKSAQLI